MSIGYEPSAEALMARIAGRDPSALLELYDRLAPFLMGVVSRIAPTHQTAARIVEDTFVRLWDEAPRFPLDKSSVAVWLFLLARRSALELRRLAISPRSPSHAFKVLEDGSYFWLPWPEEVARLEEKGEPLKKVIDQLPKPQRIALDLAVFEGLSQEEIALKLGEPLGRVKASLRAGMRFIRHRMRAFLGTWSANI